MMMYVHGRRSIRGNAFTRQERIVATWISTGKTNPEIAERLKLSKGTIKAYSSRIFRKAGVSNRTELALWWIKTHQNVIITLPGENT